MVGLTPRRSGARRSRDYDPMRIGTPGYSEQLARGRSWDQPGDAYKPGDLRDGLRSVRVLGWRMSEQAIVPPETAGWMVRVTTAPAMEEFYVAAIPDKLAAEDAVKTRTGALANEKVDGVATLSQSEITGQNLQPGQIKPA